MKAIVIMSMLCWSVLATGLARAQQVTAISSIWYGMVNTCPVVAVSKGAAPDLKRPSCEYNAVQSNSVTEEDYVLQAYYDVQTTGALYEGSNPTPLQTGITGIGSPIASGSFIQQLDNSGLYTIATAHYLVAFYVVSGGYYDPYGFETSPVEDSGDDGYWIHVFVVGTTVVAQNILLGTSYSTTSVTPSLNSGLTQYPVLYQVFIPAPYVLGPPDFNSLSCSPVYYLGDNRGLNPTLGSARAFQTVTLTPTSSTGAQVPYSNTQNTGITYKFAQNAIVNGAIPASSYVLSPPCNLLIATTQASTATMLTPAATRSDGSTAVAYLRGSVANPLSVPQFLTPAIDWNHSLSVSAFSAPGPGLTQSLANWTLNYSHDCFPAHEISLVGQDIYSYVPDPSLNTAGLAACLLGYGKRSGTASGTVYYNIVQPR